jgi:hypothetical protein
MVNSAGGSGQIVWLRAFNAVAISTKLVKTSLINPPAR